ncbi:hypothetical protein [Micromonospora sp. NPDC047730]|uniref:hypothetical protein n=1 Tax=Micromonospora sp. NPDC047730 TaxID=3364253 RepID=UPI0037101AC6
MTTADDLATQIADLTRRMEAVERSSQAPHTTVEGGTFAVLDPDGNPVFLVGEDSDGVYTAQAANGAALIASDLDLPAGSITETDISDEAITTPKLVANAVTADKIEAGAIVAGKLSADAIDGRTIRGATLIGGEIVMEGADGSEIRLYEDPVEGASLTMLPAGSPPSVRPAALTTYRDPEFTDVGTVLRGPADDDGLGTPEKGAEIILTGQSFNGTIEMRADFVKVDSQHPAEFNNAFFGGTAEVTDDLTVNANASVAGGLTVSGTATVGSTLDVTGKVTANGGLAVTGAATVGGRNVVTGPGRIHWQAATVTTNAQGIATVPHAAGFVPTAVGVFQNGATGSSAVSLFYITGTATSTAVQVKAMLNGAVFSGSVGVTLILGG